jgi:hypothetical protein
MKEKPLLMTLLELIQDAFKVRDELAARGELQSSRTFEGALLTPYISGYEFLEELLDRFEQTAPVWTKVLTGVDLELANSVVANAKALVSQ